MSLVYLRSRLFCRCLFNQCFRTLSMEDIEEVPLDCSQNVLQQLVNTSQDKDKAVQKYLSNLKYPPVKDFNSGLEWFNVSESLSFSKHLKGKIVILDFFTYCCINCMHVIPDLRELENEFSVEDGLVVIGVHSAKFENEKLSKNILAAVQRYSIGHPVVNDHKSEMWRNCEVHCWPTLLMINPNSVPVVMLMGEGHKEELRLYIKNALIYYKSKNEISNHKLPLKSAYHLLPDLKGPLLFPGKITNFFDEDNNNELFAVSDTGNNRVLLLNESGTILEEIGGNEVGFKDGNLKEALFNNPQGLAFRNKDIIFVADTENHAIRKIDLKNNCVETVAGTGVQGHDRFGGRIGKQQSISSPWDLCVFKTKNLDALDDPKAPLKEVLIIAMAGTHQIWALFLDDIVWWKSKSYPAGSCVCIAGSGREENRNNQYPNSAAFAQPSGLALCKKNKEVFIADSESSSVRKLSLINGKVSAVVGANKDPHNLFAFGDVDGTLYDAKLQHALGLALSRDENTLFVADTYNHKLKSVDVSKNAVKTLSSLLTDTTDGKSLVFNEPAGLCVGSNGKIYLADTNNHSIKILQLNDDKIVNIQNLELCLKNYSTNVNKNDLQIIEGKNISVNSKGGKIIIKFSINFENGLGITSDAPQKWSVDVPNASWSCVPSSGRNINDIDIVISVPPSIVEELKPCIDFVFNLVTCTAEKCLPKNFIVRQSIVYDNQALTAVENVINVCLNPTDVIMK